MSPEDVKRLWVNTENYPLKIGKLEWARKWINSQDGVEKNWQKDMQLKPSLE